MDKNQGKKGIILGISVGDINGIGLEVALKSFEDERMLEFCTPVFFASNKTVSEYKRLVNFDLNFHGISDLNQILIGKINVLNVWRDQPEITLGQENEVGGKYAILSLRAAVTALKNQKIDILVTAPISKKNIQSQSFSFPGHTDFLNQELQGNSLMLMVSEELRVGLLTDHIPVKEVPNAITTKLIREKVQTMNTCLIQDFGIIRPKIAMLGINPHSGDNGTIGDEDQKILVPAINQLFEEGYLVYGPYPADGFFGNQQHLKFDGILAAYHDQGLVPFKTLSFGKGVNFTAGLDRVRTSPDHGTAFDLAGKGLADEGSFKEALFLGIHIYKNRKRYKKYTANPLKTKPQKA